MEKQEKKLFLLDAMALIYRAYFALNKNPRITSTGINTSAFLGFANTLLELLKKERPTHLGVAFDTMAPTARHLEYTDYKANREKMPEDIAVALPYILQLLQGMKIPVLKAEGYEADDVIGTVAKQAEKDGFTVYMVTPDKDFGQLVSEHVFIYKPAYKGNGVEILGPAEVCAKFGIENPLQVIDMLGLWGDASDNIPGVPGVGEVTARKLLAQFGSLENLLERTDEVPNEKLREKIRQHAGQARESKMLATILLDAPVAFEPEALALSAPDMDAVASLLDELEMRSLSARFLSFYRAEPPSLPLSSSPDAKGRALPKPVATNPAPPAGTAVALDLFSPENMAGSKPFICPEEERRALVWENPEELRKGLSYIAGTGRKVAFCLHPDSLQASVRHAGIDYMAFALENAPQEGLPMRVFGYRVEGRLGQEEKAALLTFLFSTPWEGRLSCYDMKTQLHLLANQGIEGDLQAFDILLAHYLIDPETGHDLMRLVCNYLPYDYAPDRSGRDLFSGCDSRFCFQNVRAMLLLRGILEPRLEETGAMPLFEKVEIPLAGVLCRMEREGVKLDTERLSAYGKELEAEMREEEQEIYRLAGTTFNIASPKQLGDVLYGKLQITQKPKHTRTKQFSTAEDVLQKLLHKHPIVEKVLRYRHLAKLKSTYVDALPLLIDASTGRVHTTYNQAVTATGRLSSQNPNLQNIPVRTESGREIRRCFTASGPGYCLVSADYSQIELRIIAQLSGDEAMLQDFSRHKDVHTATAANVFNVPPREVTPEMRRRAKTVNFGIIYGISPFGLAERLQIPRKEASELIERYFANYPRLHAYMEEVVAQAKERGYVETLLHRRRYLKDINSGNAVVRAYAERNAVNAPVQGSSADMIKLAMIAIDRKIREKGLASRMLLQVHDELVFNVPLSELDVLQALVEEEMKTALPMQVPIEVEVNHAGNWLDAH